MTPQTASFVRIVAVAADRDAAERAAAEAFEAGAAGLEEREGAGVIELIVYAPAGAATGVAEALARVAERVGLPSELADADWSEAWKEQLTAIEISPQLVVRPSFVSFRRRPGQHELVIDPGQAFGTGSHESTRLALEWVDALARDLAPDAQVLDVGCGTGVLALAALRLAPVRAVALDLDPLAAEATRENASRNALARRLRCFTGGVTALRPALRFELVVANLLRRELAPLLPDLATRMAPRGRLVLSGLLETERADVAAHAGRLGLVLRAEKTRSDAGDVTWLALCLSARS